MKRLTATGDIDGLGGKTSPLGIDAKKDETALVTTSRCKVREFREEHSDRNDEPPTFPQTGHWDRPGWHQDDVPCLSDGTPLLYADEQCKASSPLVPSQANQQDQSPDGGFTVFFNTLLARVAAEACRPREKVPKGRTQAYLPPASQAARVGIHPRATRADIPEPLSGFSPGESPFPLDAMLRQHRLERERDQQMAWPRTLDFLLNDQALSDVATELMNEKSHNKHLGGLLFDMARELMAKAQALASSNPELSALYRHASWHVCFLRLFIRVTPPEGVEGLAPLLPPEPLPGLEAMEFELLTSYQLAKTTGIKTLVINRAERLKKTHAKLFQK